MKLSQKYNKNNSQKPTDQPTDQKPTSETQEKTNKNPWMWGKDLYNRGGDDREGKEE